jgi:hypothetical protein
MTKFAFFDIFWVYIFHERFTLESSNYTYREISSIAYCDEEFSSLVGSCGSGDLPDNHDFVQNQDFDRG